MATIHASAIVDSKAQLADNVVIGPYAVIGPHVTMNEPFFQGHFPDFPVMPGVLIIEALAQTAALLTFSEEHDPEDVYYFAGIDGARFKRIVLPGDQLIMHATFERGKAGIYKFQVKATVQDELAAEASITCAVRKKSA